MFKRCNAMKTNSPTCLLFISEALLSFIVIAEREQIAHTMQSVLDEATDPWGVKGVKTILSHFKVFVIYNSQYNTFWRKKDCIEMGENNFNCFKVERVEM